MSVFAVFNGVGRPLFGWLTDKITPQGHGACCRSPSFSARRRSCTSPGKGSAAVYFVAFSLLWLNLGGWLAIAPTATATFFGAKHYAKNYGIVFTAYGIGAILGNLLSGMIHDATGSYLPVFVPVMGLAGRRPCRGACSACKPPAAPVAQKREEVERRSEVSS